MNKRKLQVFVFLLSLKKKTLCNNKFHIFIFEQQLSITRSKALVSPATAEFLIQLSMSFKFLPFSERKILSDLLNSI